MICRRRTRRFPLGGSGVHARLRYPDHEWLIGAIARRTGFTQVSESHARAADESWSAGRHDVVDAYLSPIITRLRGSCRQRTGRCQGAVHAVQRRLTDSGLSAGRTRSLSGPAAGSSAWPHRAGPPVRAGDRIRHGRHVHRRVAFAGEFERQYETQVAGVRMRAPMLSITRSRPVADRPVFRRQPLPRRPDSAGADPGPPAIELAARSPSPMQCHARPDSARATSHRCSGLTRPAHSRRDRGG